MSNEVVTLLGILTALSLYSVLSAIELAVALMRVEPRFAPVRPAKRVFTPRWEITNVLLAAGLLGLTVRFYDATVAIIHATWPVLLTGFLALVARAGMLIYLYATKAKPGGRLSNYVFAFASTTVPLSLGSAGIYMLTGEPFWQSGVGVTLFAALVAGLVALAFGFMYYLGGKKAPQGVVVLSRVANLAMASLLAIVLAGVLSGDSSHLLNLPYAYLAVIAASIVLIQAVLMAANREWRMWWCLAVLALLVPFLVCWANYPYLVYPEFMLDTAATPLSP